VIYGGRESCEGRAVEQLREMLNNRLAYMQEDGESWFDATQNARIVRAAERYYRLISDFNELTGVPVILNTSFNENEPVVCKPEEALACFLRTKLDILVLGDFVISRTG